MNKDKETVTKRTYTVPVLLVLLTGSLIGIVLLFSLNLQHNQETNRQQGEDIIKAGQAAKAHVNEVAFSLDKLAASSGEADRLSLLYNLGYSFRGSDALLAFIEASEEHAAPGGQTQTSDQPRKLLEAISDTLDGIGAHPGQLNDIEAQYVKQVLVLYQQLEQTLSGFTLETGDKMVEMTAQTGGSWVQLGQQLEKTLEQAEVGTNGAIPDQLLNQSQ
ncbi:hypothetical protein [Paenibacillus kobensis]|uniref:hypothetical protein n=1 Tax=Paenibacillus kobensis TaxID=59841 RepID=UPI000FDCDBE5|nr:hypothetical protein [Paenibacillus kobensis]